MKQDTAIPIPRQRPPRPHRAAPTARVPLTAAGGPESGRPVRSLYIHVPFCSHKCHYCDFYSFVDARDRQGAFVERLTRELDALAPWAGGAPLETIFIGGGTPSLLAPPLWARLLGALDDLFGLAAGAEFTVECNPESVTPELMDLLASGGVNRISLGAQSFNVRHLRTLERRHDPQSLPIALDAARAAGIGRLSLDLIFAVPGQTVEDWGADLRTALALGTTHLSCYNLTYEPNTAMTMRLRRGEFTPCDEDAEVAMYEHALSALRGAGLERYEVSNFAAPGQECRHNLAYWRQEQWLAAGPSASAHVGGWRWKNIPRLDDYLSADDAGFAPITDVEEPDGRRALCERVMTGLRLAEGLDSAGVLDTAGRVEPGSERRLEHLAGECERLGLLLASGGKWVLTDPGLLIADALATDFMAALDPSPPALRAAIPLRQVRA